MFPPLAKRNYSLSNPWLVKISATVLGYNAHNLIRRPRRNLPLQLERDSYLRADKPGKVRDDLVRNPAGIEPNTSQSRVTVPTHWSSVIGHWIQGGLRGAVGALCQHRPRRRP